ncbi:hypothetical protein [Ornithinimicrobium kibberense]|uniref:hypothetical protein n=1 Tax=Ornithinimicrobium kibberense TaxID=282060 RepID=UPI00361B94D7
MRRPGRAAGRPRGTGPPSSRRRPRRRGRSPRPPPPRSPPGRTPPASPGHGGRRAWPTPPGRPPRIPPRPGGCPPPRASRGDAAPGRP